VAELLETEIDAVYIATPVHLHCQQVIEAAEAGKHVLCEKPLGLTHHEAETMVRACERHNVSLGIGLFMRYHSQHRQMRELIRTAKIGTPVYARAQLSCWYPKIPNAWRQEKSLSGGGSVVDLGCHCLDLIEFLLGKIRRVCCNTARLVQEYEVEDSAVLLCEMESGAMATIDCFFNVPDDASQNRLEVYGSMGSIFATGTIGQSAGGLVELRASPQGAYDASQQRGAASTRVIESDGISPYRRQVEAFAQAILRRTAPPVGASEALRVQRLIAASYESSAKSAWVDV
jgi:predicted dehydrogenase